MVDPVYSDYPPTIEERFHQLEQMIGATCFLVVVIVVMMFVAQTKIIRELHDTTNIEVVENSG